MPVEKKPGGGRKVMIEGTEAGKVESGRKEGEEKVH